MQVLGPGLVVVSWWNEEVVQLSPSVLWPLARPLAFPAHKLGVIGVLPWVFICQQCVDRVVDLCSSAAQAADQLKASWNSFSTPGKVQVDVKPDSGAAPVTHE
mmetsp:Transcript_5096/g.9755  ORF Transcript_5096/g.9755 Transcript_5096/m.9755 type:complete len:103 (-) Transcript_5096:25-333(-)